MRFTSFLTVSTIGLALVACRSDSSNKTDGSPGGDSGSNGGTVKIQDVQNDMMAPGTPVKLSGVIVTAIDAFGSKTGDIWVEEPEGGPYSGVHVYKADTTAVASLAVGDIVDISNAIKDEFALSGSSADPTGRTETELEPSGSGQTIMVTKTGTGTVPAPADVDALMIGQMPDADMQGSAFSAAWEQWEGVLIKTSNVSALSAPKSFGSTMPIPADNYDFGITGVAKVEGSLCDITMSGIARNTCFASVTGVVSYFYDYLIYPTQTSDMVTGGTACPAAEVACTDNIDNDGNGFADCKDNNCIINDSTCSTTTTISALDAAADANPASPTLPANGVKLSGVCVTAVPTGTSPSSAYLSTNAAGGADNGIFLFGGGTPLPAGVTKGTKVDVVGTVSAFKSSGSTAPEGQLELAGLQVTMVNGTCTPTAANETSDMSVLTQDANGHPLIGSLVTLAPTGAHSFKITTAQTATGKFGVLTENGTTVKFGVTMLPLVNNMTPSLGAVGDCFQTITGIWTYDTTGAGGYEILPTTMPTKLGACVP